MREPWTLVDYTKTPPEVWEMPINPSGFDEPVRQPNVSNEVTVAPDGQVIFFQGQDNPATGSFDGVIRTKEQKEAVKDWFGRRWPLELTDDQGNVWQILVTKLTLPRTHKASTDYYYRYSVEFLVVQ